MNADSGYGRLFTVDPLTSASFGGRISLTETSLLDSAVCALESSPALLAQALYDAGGLLYLSGLNEISAEPGLLTRLSRLFGPEVEDYEQTLTERNKIHPEFSQILQITNMPPSCQMPPVRPDPPLTPAGGLPVKFPHRRGWHTDQSFRRPPPDISLFYAVIPSPPGQGQTLYADAAGAYDALSADLKATVAALEGIHAIPGIGRAEYAVKAGETPKPLLPHQWPQRQPVVRMHPVTGRQSLYLCEAGQMDWIDGPFVGMEPGPEGDGAELLYELMMHITQPKFTYVHEWSQGDLLIWDNRNLLHCATWYDAQNHQRLMWRTTARGNPGELYSGEGRSWLPEDDARPMTGLGND